MIHVAPAEPPVGSKVRNEGRASTGVAIGDNPGGGTVHVQLGESCGTCTYFIQRRESPGGVNIWNMVILLPKGNGEF